ncbi:tRNA modification GTPase [Brevinema andersonii]|uniref:tRNA modification GTPase MnmE n=1 Tax=Brevinema andersonii TaxID=34097 RepID=A0A1I1EK29_BREAD|nr:tRNA uridine-5-carboxymethylaminomethyl(34) synthesis GTPase MnmE [Brevinema andersonii]SFB86982.1 tRNA modification GTPase [Brevinema andersonii]
MISEKIIAAPATAQGIGAVGMIRISGKGCISQCDCFFRSEKTLSDRKPNTIAYGKWIDPDTSQCIDEVLVGIFHAPHSFTGEESLEIWTHGSPFIMKEMMRVLLVHGIAAAAPGEFTMRAFLNGKLDLTEAEAIRDLTHAQTKMAHTQALGRLEGKLSAKIHHLHNAVLDLLAMLEAAIDHADEDLDFETQSHTLQRIDECILQIDTLLLGAQTGRMSVDGIKVALIGRPNVGKSSLLNALAGEDRVIVSDIAGTTRDVVEFSMSARGLLIKFFDTAGIRSTEDPIEREGTKRSLKILEEADMVFVVIDTSQQLQDDDLMILQQLPADKVCFILNKSDLPCVLSLESFEEGRKISVSAATGDGLEQIFDFIAEFYRKEGIDPENDILIANARQENLLKSAKKELQMAKKCLCNQEFEELTVSHVRKARIFVEEITGKTNDNAILDRIFSQFCIGK